MSGSPEVVAWPPLQRNAEITGQVAAMTAPIANAAARMQPMLLGLSIPPHPAVIDAPNMPLRDSARAGKRRHRKATQANITAMLMPFGTKKVGGCSAKRQ